MSIQDDDDDLLELAFGGLSSTAYKIMSDKTKFYQNYIGCPIIVNSIIDRFNTVFDVSSDPFYQKIYEQSLIDELEIRHFWPPNYMDAIGYKNNRLNIYFKKINQHLYEIKKVNFG